ncbi:unnamed protein product, partial [Symbiodinium necroappetens]
EYGGAGGNAYVVRFTSPCGAIPRGSVAKAFVDDEIFTSSYNVLNHLPDVKALAGLVPAKKKFDGLCVHVKKTDECCSTWKATKTCHFLVMQDGGAKTLEQCVEGYPLPAGKLKELMLSAIKAALSFHKKGWYHGDYQLKNLMVDHVCTPNTLKVVDLDGMGNEEGTAGEAWNKPHRMLKDYAMLFGSCGLGAMPIAEFTYKSTTTKQEADRIAAAVAPVMSPFCDGAWNSRPEDIVELGQRLKSAVEAVN